MTTQSIEIMLDCSSKQELFPVSVGQQILFLSLMW